MVVIEQHAEILKGLGLDTLEGVRKAEGRLIKNQRGRRDILLIEVSDPKDPEGRPLLLFLKRIWKAYKKDGITSLLQSGKVRSISRVEWENSKALQRAGFSTAPLIAYGEERSLLWENFSFLITAKAEGDKTVDEFLRSETDFAKRRCLLHSLALWVRSFHEAGFATPDLFLRHLFVRSREDRTDFCLIDMARLDQKTVIGFSLRVRDLTALNLTALRSFCSDRERVFFLQVYLGAAKIPKGWIQAILKRMSYLMRRGKFKNF